MIEDKLLQTAIEQFGLHGPDGASTRDIARAAGTAMSSITYHYGGKEGLYLAAADYITEFLRERLQPIIDTVPPEDAPMSADEATGHAMNVVEAMTRIMIAEESACPAAFIIREQMHPTQAFERIYDGAMARMITLLARLVERATGIEDPIEIRLISMGMVGQSMVLRSARAAVHRGLGITQIDAEMQQRICNRVRTNVMAMLAAARIEE